MEIRMTAVKLFISTFVCLYLKMNKSHNRFTQIYVHVHSEGKRDTNCMWTKCTCILYDIHEYMIVLHKSMYIHINELHQGMREKKSYSECNVKLCIMCNRFQFIWYIFPAVSYKFFILLT